MFSWGMALWYSNSKDKQKSGDLIFTGLNFSNEEEKGEMFCRLKSLFTFAKNNTKR